MRAFLLLLVLSACDAPATTALLSRGDNSIEPCTVTRQQAVQIADNFCRAKGETARLTMQLGPCVPGGLLGIYEGSGTHFECSGGQ